VTCVRHHSLPAAGYQAEQDDDGYDCTAHIDNELNDIGPDDCSETPLIGVNQSEDGDDQYRPNFAGSQHNAHNRGDRENPDTVRQGPRDEENARRGVLDLGAKAPLHQLIGRVHFPLEVGRNQDQANDYPPDDITEN